MQTATGVALRSVAAEIAKMIEIEAAAGKMLYRTPAEIETMLRKEQGYYHLGDNGDPISFCGWYEYDGFIEVGSTITHPQHRGLGLATACLYRVLAAIQDSSKQIVAFCNDASTRLFLGVGFSEQQKFETPAEAKDFCSGCVEFSAFPNCHCNYLAFGHKVTRTSKGIWQTLIQDPVGATLLSVAELYCQVWAEPPWYEYDWDIAEVERELAEASADPGTIFIASQSPGKINGFSLGFPLDGNALAEKAGGDQLGHLCQGADQIFYIADLGVAFSARGYGTGDLLTRHLLGQAEKSGFKRFVLRTDIAAHPARALYAKLGFVDTSIADSNHPSRTYWVRNI